MYFFSRLVMDPQADDESVRPTSDLRTEVLLELASAKNKPSPDEPENPDEIQGLTFEVN